MHLGELIKKLRDESYAVETILALGDLGLLLRVEKVAADNDLRFGEAVTRTVVQFTAYADADQWAQLMSAIKRADDPGSAALKQMLKVALPHGG